MKDKHPITNDAAIAHEPRLCVRPCELRIGNYVEYNGSIKSIGKVTSIVSPIISGQDFVRIDYRVNKRHYFHAIKPILLTEQWLINFGFLKPNSLIVEYARNGFELYFLTTDEFYQAEFGGFMITLKYVHQLQNLYFILMNEELAANTLG